MDLTEILNKLNKIMYTNQKLHTGHNVINIHLDNLKPLFELGRITRNNQKNEGRPERH